MILLNGKFEGLHEVIVSMDHQIFEETKRNTIVPKDTQTFVDRYCVAHEKIKGERFQLKGRN